MPNSILETSVSCCF